MANYRPKSLDELSNLYDKSLEAENEIKKSSSRLEDKGEQVTSAFLPEENMITMKKTAEQIASDEIADKVDNFAKSFGNSDTAKNPITIATVQSRPRPPRKKPDEIKTGTEKGSNKAPEKEEARPKLIRNSERSSLFENYKKVMNDEDDYNFAEPEKVKSKLRKNKSSKKAQKEQPQQENTENKDEITVQAQAAVDAVFEKEENKSAADEIVEEKAESSAKTEETAEKEEEEYFNPFEDETDTAVSVATVAVERKNPGLQILLMVLLLCVLIVSVGIGCIKAFSGVNSDNAFMDKYQVYSANSAHTESQIKKGDLVIAESRQPSEGEAIVYKLGEGAYAFAKFESVLNAESVIASDGDEQIVVLDSEYKGVVTGTVPVIGTVFAVMSEYFLPVMGLMLLLSALLIVLIFFVSREKKELVQAEDVEAEDNEEYILAEEAEASEEQAEEYDSDDSEDTQDEEETASVFE